jgi:hypothetical protein
MLKWQKIQTERDNYCFTFYFKENINRILHQNYSDERTSGTKAQHKRVILNRGHFNFLSDNSNSSI